MSVVLCLIPLTGMLRRLQMITVTKPIKCKKRTCHCKIIPIILMRIITSISLGFSNVEIGVTSDGRTIVCHHPTVDVPYELTQVI